MKTYKFKFMKPMMTCNPQGFGIIRGDYPNSLQIIENQQIMKEYPKNVFRIAITETLGWYCNEQQTNYKSLQKILFKYIQKEIQILIESNLIDFNQKIEDNFIQFSGLSTITNPDYKCPYDPKDLDEVEGCLFEIILQTEQEKILNLISNNNISEAIEEKLKVNPSSVDIILVKSRYNKLNNDKKLGTITKDEENAELNKIKQAVLNF